jgi:hypothetical protein
MVFSGKTLHWREERRKFMLNQMTILFNSEP